MEGKDLPKQIGQKEYDELGKMVSLMLRMCRPFFGSGKAVVLDSDFFVVKGITDVETKGLYAGALIKKWRYWTKLVPGYLIDTQFEDKEVVNVGMLKARTQDNKSFRIFSIKYPYYVMKMKASWMTLDELEVKKIRRDFLDISGTEDMKKFTYWQPFGLHFRYIYQVYNHNN